MRITLLFFIKDNVILFMNSLMSSNTVPEVIFIVPYRSRPQHKYFFSLYYSNILKEANYNYEIYFSHQCDARSFNRGAVKNIGFITLKNKYPNDYKNITFVFNDIDTIPFSLIFDYKTKKGVVKHFYGFKYALGGIVAINGEDFENTNGFPNFWGWGMEDNVLQKRCENLKLTIDRTQFFPIGNPNILHLFDGISRIINRKDPWRASHDDRIDGIKTINKLKASIDRDSKNNYDNIHIYENNNIFIINISTFMTGVKFEDDNYVNYDLREPPRKIINPSFIKTKKISFTTDDWSNIPFYPNIEQKRIMEKKYGKNNVEEIINYNLENSTQPFEELIPQNIVHPNMEENQNQNNNQKQNEIRNANISPIKYNIPFNKYSPNYNKLINLKPKATSSVNIRLGGIY